MPRLLLFHDFTSAFCRVALPLAREASQAVGVELDLIPFELFPAPWTLPSPTDALDPELAAARPWAEALGLAMTLPARTPRTRKAHEAMAYAREAGSLLAMAEALYDALWHRGLDIGRLDVIGGLAEEIGLDGAGLHVALGVDAHAAEVLEAQRAAEASGVSSVPTLRLGSSELVGLVSRSELASWLASSEG